MNLDRVEAGHWGEEDRVYGDLRKYLVVRVIWLRS